MQQTEATIINKLGLHASAASKLAKLAGEFEADVTLIKEEKSVDAKSIMQVMMLAASKGMNITIQAEGSDQDQAVEAITQLIADKFEEDE